MSASNSKLNGATTKRSRARRNNNTSNRSRNNTTSNFVTKAALHGGKFSPSTNPPDVSYQPWWPLTVVNTHTGGVSMTVKDICDTVRTQTDPNSRGFNPEKSDQATDKAFRMQIRIISISAWNLSGRMIALSVEDFTDSGTSVGGRDQLCGIVDTGNVNHTPSAGFRLPASVSAHVLRNDDKGGKLAIFETQSAASDIVVVYVNILFRFDGPVKIPNVTDPIIRELERTNEVSKDSLCDLDELNLSLERLKDTIDNLIKTQPSTTSRVINGITTLAAYVVPMTTELSATLAKTASAVERNQGLEEPFVEL